MAHSFITVNQLKTKITGTIQARGLIEWLNKVQYQNFKVNSDSDVFGQYWQTASMYQWHEKCFKIHQATLASSLLCWLYLHKQLDLYL
jgi:hypothetical protein